MCHHIGVATASGRLKEKFTEASHSQLIRQGEICIQTGPLLVGRGRSRLELSEERSVGLKLCHRLDPLKPCGAVHVARERSMLQVTLLLRGMGVAPFQLRRSLSGVRVFCGRHDTSERLIVTLSGFRR